MHVCQAFVDHGMQASDQFIAQAFIERQLRPLPLALCLGAFFTAQIRGTDQARAPILTRANVDPALRHQRLKVARQGGGVHLHHIGQLARPHRLQPDDLRQQRILRRLQPGVSDDLVEMLAHPA